MATMLPMLPKCCPKGPRPQTAYPQTSWWTQKRLAHVRAWQARGWRAHVARRRAFVIFTRDAKEA